MTSVDDIQTALLATLGELVENHARLESNETPALEPILRLKVLDESAAKIQIAKLMCHRAGVPNQAVQVIEAAGMLRGRA